MSLNSRLEINKEEEEVFQAFSGSGGIQWFRVEGQGVEALRAKCLGLRV